MPVNRSESKYFNTAVKMDKALIALLGEKSFEYITVREICQKAEVNRSTFYLHYENTRDLLDETVQYLFDVFLSYFNADSSSFSKKLRSEDVAQLNFITEEYLHPYLTYIRENCRVFATAITHAKAFGFEETFGKLYRNVFDPVLDRFAYPVGDRTYVMMFYLNGINAVVVEWVKNGCRESIEEMCRVIQICIFGLHEFEQSVRENA